MRSRVAVVYATREGHTRLVAEHVAAALRVAGFDVDVHQLAARRDALDLAPYSALLLAASVHLHHHEREMVAFARKHRAELERRPSAFLSVSLSEAGAEDARATPQLRARAAAEVRGALEVFFKETGWHPHQVLAVAGALPYTKYNLLLRFLMTLVARSDGSPTDTSRDYDFTDWRALDAFVGGLAKVFVATPAPGEASTPGRHAAR